MDKADESFGPGGFGGKYVHLEYKSRVGGNWPIDRIKSMEIISHGTTQQHSTRTDEENI